VTESAQSEKKGKKTYLTVLAALLGLAASPAVFVLAIAEVGFLMPWLWHYRVSALALALTLFVPIVIGIAWSIFAAVGWKRGNIGIRIGLTAIVWALVGGAEAVFLARCMLGGG